MLLKKKRKKKGREEENDDEEEVGGGERGREDEVGVKEEKITKQRKLLKVHKYFYKVPNVYFHQAAAT